MVTILDVDNTSLKKRSMNDKTVEYIGTTFWNHLKIKFVHQMCGRRYFGKTKKALWHICSIDSFKSLLSLDPPHF